MLLTLLGTSAPARVAIVDWASLEVPAVTARTLTADAASFTLTGNSAALSLSTAAQTVAFALTGNSAALSLSTAAQTVAFTLTGNAAGALRTSAAQTVAFTLTGNAAGALRTSAAATASFALTGIDVNLTKTGSYSLPAVAASFVLSGVDVGLAKTTARVARALWAAFEVPPLPPAILTAQTGSFTENGIAAGLLHKFTQTADVATFTLSGADATLSRSYHPRFAQVSYARLETPPPIAKVLTADTASLTITGPATRLAAGRVQIADAAAFTLTGNDVGEFRTYAVDVFWEDIGPGESSYRLKWGQASGGPYPNSVDLIADITSYTITGLADRETYYWVVMALVDDVEQDISAQGVFTVNIPPLAADAVAFYLAGIPANLNKAGTTYMAVTPGDFAVSGVDAGYYLARVMPADVAGYTMTASDAGFLLGLSIVMPADAGHFTLTGFPIGFSDFIFPPDAPPVSVVFHPHGRRIGAEHGHGHGPRLGRASPGSGSARLGRSGVS
jgi:hypothetical protein